jgi:hypothetical protein
MLDKVEIVFENCEYLTLTPKEIYSIYLDGIESFAHGYNLYTKEPGFTENKLAKKVFISLYIEALKNKKTSLCNEDESNALERLEYNDITQIHIYTKKFLRKKRLIYMVNYKPENEKLGARNIYQSCITVGEHININIEEPL